MLPRAALALGLFLIATSVMLGLNQRSHAAEDRDERLTQIADRQIQTLTHYFDRAWCSS